MQGNFLLLISVVIICFSCHRDDADRSSHNADAELVKQALSEINPKDQPLIFRRSTLIVRDVEKSLALYRDAMGMEVIYDQTIERPHPFEEGKEQKVKLIFLKALDQFQGVLGLVDYEYESETKAEVPIRKEGFSVQNVVLLFNTNDLDARFAKIKEVPDVDIISEPKLTQYPSYDGESIIEVMVSKFYDPDGFIVEFNQLLTDI